MPECQRKNKSRDINLEKLRILQLKTSQSRSDLYFLLFNFQARQVCKGQMKFLMLIAKLVCDGYNTQSSYKQVGIRLLQALLAKRSNKSTASRRESHAKKRDQKSIVITELKVRKFQNENMKSHCPKYERKNQKNSALKIFKKIFIHILGNATASYFHSEIN